MPPDVYHEHTPPVLASTRPWRIELLGGIRLIHQNQPVGPLVTRLGIVLFARIVCSPERVHARLTLTEELWPEEEEEVGAQRFRKTLSRLREELGPSADTLILARRHTLAVHADALSTDVAEFQHAVRAARLADSSERKKQALERAIALYKGEFLPGFYEDWIVQERQRLHDLFIDIQQRRQTLLQESDVPSPRSSAVPPLPSPINRFFGREEEKDQAVACLTDVSSHAPLITLIGMGGAGKTRLALVVAHTLLAHFKGNVAFIHTQQATSAAELPERLRDALGLPPAHGADPHQQIEALVNTLPRALFVWDNFENQTEQGAGYLQYLRHRFSHVAHLVTSRRQLGLSGEQTIPLSPLPTPDQSAPPERLLEFPAIALFCDRARAAQHDFSLTTSNADLVRRLCLYLEGIPLALELAAPLVSLLSVNALLERMLGRRFALLKNRLKDAAAHQGSLHAVLQSSYSLLAVREQRLLERLSVFVGGFFLEGAEAVCAEDAERAVDPLAVLDGLSLLRDHSFLTTETLPNGQLRFRMLETIRDFSRIVSPVEQRERTAERHAAEFERLGQMTPSRLSTAQESGWLDRLEADAQNLHAAIRYLSDVDLSRALMMMAHLDHFYIFRGRLAEARALAAELLRKQGNADPVARLMVCNAASQFALFAGDFPATLDYATEGETLASSLEQPEERHLPYLNRARALPHLYRTRALIALGRLTEAETTLETALPLFPPRAHPLVLEEQATIAFLQGKYDRARERLSIGQSERNFAQDPRAQAYYRYWNGLLLLHEGELRSAETMLRESLDHLRGISLLSHVPSTLIALATSLLLGGEVGEALSVATEACRYAAQQGHRLLHLQAQHLRAAVLIEYRRRGEASRALLQALSLCQEHDATHIEARILEAVADLATDPTDARALIAFCDQLREQSEVQRDPLENRIHRRLSLRYGNRKDMWPPLARDEVHLIARTILREQSSADQATSDTASTLE